jgi:uncharacterized protein
MTYHPVILVDSSLLIAFYNSTDNYHTQPYYQYIQQGIK